MTSTYAPTLYKQSSEASIAHRIRALRKARGWTLADVERLSRGSFKAVVLGSYERGDRTLSLPRAIQLAEVFGLPLVELLSEPDSLRRDGFAEKLIIDLRKLNNLENASPDQERNHRALELFVAWIAGQRKDWNGEILTIRRSDLDLLGLMTFSSPESVLVSLKERHLIMKGPNPL